MTLALLLVLVAAGVMGYRISTPQERIRALHATQAYVDQWQDVFMRGREKSEPFRRALEFRARWPIVTAAIVVLNVLIFARMLFGAGQLSATETLLSWGANFGPRTTNGEWWRLVTAMFVHSGFFHLTIEMIGLWQVSSIVERLAGRATLAAVFIAAGVFANMVTLSMYQATVTVGGSGAIYGVYGLFITTLIWGFFRARAARKQSDEPAFAGAREALDDDRRVDEKHVGSTILDATDPQPLAVPTLVLKRMLPAVVLFVGYELLFGDAGMAANLTGVVVGLLAGLVLAKHSSVEAATPRRIGWAAGVALVVAVIVAFPLRGIADVKPEIARVLATEERTAGVYKDARGRFQNGRMTANQLADLIDSKIVPDLHAAETQLHALQHVPPEHRPLVATADQYYRLRSESWTLRAKALREAGPPPSRAPGTVYATTDSSWRIRAEARHRTNAITAGRAEATERESLETLDTLKTAAQ